MSTNFHDMVAKGKLLRISSQDKQAGQSNSDFYVNFNNSSYAQRKIKALVVKTISFKHVFPNLFKTSVAPFAQNTLFKMKWNGADVEAEVPQGWYSASELADTLTNIMNALPTVSGFLVELQSSPIPALQRKYVFSSSGVSFQLLGKDSGNTMADVLGIPFDTADDISTKIATYLPDLGGTTMAYLCSSDLGTSQLLSSSQNGGQNENVISEIPITGAFGSEIYYEPDNSELTALVFQGSDNQLTRMSLRLCARNGSVLDLQQNDLTVVFKIL